MTFLFHFLLPSKGSLRPLSFFREDVPSSSIRSRRHRRRRPPHHLARARRGSGVHSAGDSRRLRLRLRLRHRPPLLRVIGGGEVTQRSKEGDGSEQDKEGRGKRLPWTRIVGGRTATPPTGRNPDDCEGEGEGEGVGNA